MSISATENGGLPGGKSYGLTVTGLTAAEANTVDYPKTLEWTPTHCIVIPRGAGAGSCTFDPSNFTSSAINVYTTTVTAVDIYMW